MSDSASHSWEDAVRWLLSQPNMREFARACYFDRPAVRAAERFHSSDEWNALRKYLPSAKGKALDVGAGMGIASFALARDGWVTTALEPDASNLVGVGAIRRLTAESGVPIEVVQDWGERLPFSDESFDLVHGRQVFHHASDLERLCCELFRVLKIGGTLVGTREHVVSSTAQLKRFLDSHPLHAKYGGENAFSLRRYIGAFESAGFTIRVVIGPLESVINFAPFTEDELCAEIVRRTNKYFGLGRLLSMALDSQLRRITLRLLSRLDQRPGRLYTFVCSKQSHV